MDTGTGPAGAEIPARAVMRLSHTRTAQAKPLTHLRAADTRIFGHACALKFLP